MIAPSLLAEPAGAITQTAAARYADGNLEPAKDKGKDKWDRAREQNAVEITLQLGKPPETATHGPTPPHTQKNVDRMAEQMARLTAERGGGEFAALVEIESGLPVGPVLKGAAHEVSLGKHYYAMALNPSKAYAQIHSHPNEGGFSPQDIGILLSTKHFAQMTVRDPEGWVYEAKKVPGAKELWPSDVRRLTKAVHQEMKAEYRRLYPNAAAQAESLKLPEKEQRRIFADIIHLTNERLATRLGYIYTRRKA